ncbi:sterol esterase [Wolfiporia cocos MD-104 SS10]|uniref:Carboxylic ester hydrolase n=1 Tax=Wolfiporia cocos (strain MD-104) TaxID=742152 RepID=A0A2H3JYW2_WOLCO|nr:sterol esterase [Wolfiporia cocos MD-104 SS10]
MDPNSSNTAILLATDTYATPVRRTSAAHTVQLSYGTFQGNSSGNVSSFLGIPFAEPPLGDLRFAPPHPPKSFEGVRQAVSYGAGCPQQSTGANTGALPFKLPSILDPIPGVASITNTSEDCLYLNVVTPSSVDSADGLPILLWFFGGGFETGDASTYPGEPIVERSIALGQPVIFVSANYRLNAFGFLASAEVQRAGAANLGLRDQRFAMEWIQEHISAFGGDPSKVIIWGESAGAESVAYHLVMNNGANKGLFRGAFMESGFPHVLTDITDGQPYYDYLVEQTDCAGKTDTLKCLRHAPFEQLMAAINATPSYINYTSLNLTWKPRIDGHILTRDPFHSLEIGLYSKVPIVAGDCDDEGTIFSLTTLNVTTDEEFLDYIHTMLLPYASDAEMKAIGEAYPADPSLGSPYDTGSKYNITPQYKRLASFQGDFDFHAPRRLMLNITSRTQDTWAFLFKRNKEPFVGSYHTSDIAEFFTNIDYIGMDSLINFANNLDPNVHGGLPSNLSYLSSIDWKQWDSNPAAPPLLTFWDPVPSVNITADTYREDAIALLNNITLQAI